MPLKPEQLGATLERGLAPVYLVAGEEFLLVSEAADQVRRAAREAGILERELLEVQRGFDWDRLYQAGESQSLFAERKLIDLRMPGGKPGREGAAALTEYLDNSDGSNVLLVSCTTFDASSRKAKWVSAIDKAGVFVQVWPVRPAELPGWIQQRMTALGMRPEREAVQWLAQQTEGNLLAAAQEIDRFALLTNTGDGADEVSLDQVQAWVGDNSRFDVYRLVECLLAGRAADALRVAAGLQRADAPLPLLVGALTRELGVLQALSRARSSGGDLGQTFRSFGVWPARQGPLKAALGRLDDAGLDRVLALLARLDRESKGQAAGAPWQTVDELVLGLCRVARA